METAQWQTTSPGVFQQVDSPQTDGAATIADQAQPAQKAQPKVPSESRRALVRSLTEEVKKARTFWGPVFRRIRDDIDFASNGDQWEGDETDDDNDDKYKVNFIQRELNQQVATVYAKNPTVECRRVQRLEYAVWDGSEQSLMEALMTLQSSGGTDKLALAIVDDYKKGQQRKKLNDRMATTMEIWFKHQLEAQDPDFESQMKALVLREKTTSVGFVTVKFQQENASVPTASATQATIVERLERILALAKEINDDPAAAKDSAKAEEFKLMTTGALSSLMTKDAPAKLQGLVFDFEPTTSRIVDPKCRNLFGFVGADWIAQELVMSPAKVMAQWQKDVTGKEMAECGSAVPYTNGEETGGKAPSLKTQSGGRDKPSQTGEWQDGNDVCVWIIQHKRDQMQYVICDGYEDFLEEPHCPWPAVKGFWHTVAFKLTPIEVEENKPSKHVTIYGQSAVRLMRPMQQEINRSQEGLREHRVANRPGHFTAKDGFTEEDRTEISNRSPHDVICLRNVPPGSDITKCMVPIPTNKIDPALYRTDGVMQHVGLVVGTQQANIGQQGPSEKATGQAIAEQSRVQNVNSEADNLDKGLSELARIGGEMGFSAADSNTVKIIAGPGGAWPTAPEVRAAVKQSLILAIKAGSSGRPNKALEIANLDKMMPNLIQLAQGEGLPLDDLVRYVAKVLEFDFDIDEWLSKRVQIPATSVAATSGTSVPANSPAQSNGGVMPVPGSGPASMPAAAARMLPAADRGRV